MISLQSLAPVFFLCPTEGDALVFPAELSEESPRYGSFYIAVEPNSEVASSYRLDGVRGDQVLSFALTRQSDGYFAVNVPDLGTFRFRAEPVPGYRYAGFDARGPVGRSLYLLIAEDEEAFERAYKDHALLFTAYAPTRDC